MTISLCGGREKKKDMIFFKATVRGIAMATNGIWGRAERIERKVCCREKFVHLEA